MANTSTIFMGLSVIGLVATGITSGMSAIKLKDDLNLLDDVGVTKSDILLTVAKDISIPVACGAATFGCFMLARQADKKAIAGLSAAIASMSPRLYSKDENGIPIIKREGSKVVPDIVIDEDGIMYLEPTADIMIKMREETFRSGREKMNRNYQIRGALASLYELYRMWGVSKKDIKRLGIDWIKYIGWRWESMGEYSWIDVMRISNNIDIPEYGYNYIYYNPGPMPLCINPPRVVKEITHCESEDIEAMDILDGASDIDCYISSTIRDEECA